LIAKPHYLNIPELIQEVIDDTSTFSKEKGVNVLYQSSEKFPKAFLDTNLLYQVFHNLLTNAIRYSPVAKSATVEILLTQEDKNFVVSVKDQGIGIPKESQNDIFKKFYRADNALKKESDGSGFGLYIVKKIVEFSGGEIWFESEEGKGTTFHVKFSMEE